MAFEFSISERLVRSRRSPSRLSAEQVFLYSRWRWPKHSIAWFAMKPSPRASATAIAVCARVRMTSGYAKMECTTAGNAGRPATFTHSIEAPANATRSQPIAALPPGGI